MITGGHKRRHGQPEHSRDGVAGRNRAADDIDALCDHLPAKLEPRIESALWRLFQSYTA